MNRLRVFYYVYEAQSITRAADLLYVTPPAVSQQLKKLEEELDVSLFTRFNKRLVPTGNANMLFELVAPLIRGLQVGVEQMDQARNEPVGTIIFGAPIMFGATHMMKIIADFREKFPKVDFDLHLGRPSNLLKLVEDGKIDFAFIDDFPTQDKKDVWEGFDVTPVLEESVVLVCSHQYNQKVLKNKHSLKSLLNASYITQQYGELSIKKWFKHQFGIEPDYLKKVLNVSNHIAVSEAIKHGLGLGIVVAHLCQDSIRDGEMIIIRAKEIQTSNKISILKLPNKIQMLREQIFVDYSIEAMKKICASSYKFSNTNQSGLQFIYSPQDSKKYI